MSVGRLSMRIEVEANKVDCGAVDSVQALEPVGHAPAVGGFERWNRLGLALFRSDDDDVILAVGANAPNPPFGASVH